MDTLINALFTPKCLFCEKGIGSVFCKKCLNECKTLYSTYCIVCDTPSMLGTTHINCITHRTPLSCFSIFEYANYVRQCIKNSKYSSKQFMALKILTLRGIKSATKNGYKPQKNLIVIPIPLSKKREKTRGFNQAEIIAKIYAKKLSLKTTTKILKRAKETKVQYTSNRSRRFKNVEDAFTINPKYKIKGIKVLLVDDIVTSGATLLEASKTLYKNGASEVHCFALSKMEKRIKRRYNLGHDQLYIPGFTNSKTKTMAKKL